MGNQGRKAGRGLDSGTGDAVVQGHVRRCGREIMCRSQRIVQSRLEGYRKKRCSSKSGRRPLK
jgi:hypothetical protein